ncbi:MAG: isopeptide-forming domain-containing fimbrial protein, partial [Coriobacteriia bacterium]|nr:isopeptide-forming domain-containing fimbrial protein [Coriobacteriia bacterium]
MYKQNKKSKGARFISVFLSILLVLTMIPALALASGDEEQIGADIGIAATEEEQAGQQPEPIVVLTAGEEGEEGSGILDAPEATSQDEPEGDASEPGDTSEPQGASEEGGASNDNAVNALSDDAPEASSDVASNPQESSSEESSTSEEAVPNTAPSTISGNIWVDGNGALPTDWDGLRNGDEKALAGCTVYLYRADNRTSAIAQTQTRADGSYSFEGVEPGGYVVGIKDGKVSGTEYLLPMRVTAQSVFTVDWDTADDNPPYYATAFSPVLEVEGNGADILNISAGMRLPMGVMPLAGGYIVYSGSVGGTLVGNSGTLAGAVALCTGSANYFIVATQDDNNIGAAVTIPSGRNITLTSDKDGPYTLLQPSNSERHLTINSGATLTMYNIILSGNGGVSNSNLTNGGIRMTGGTLILNDGAVIENCRAYQGGGIEMSGDSRLRMYDGAAIRNNAAVTNAGAGGGVFISGSSQFTMYGGIISGNIAGTGAGMGGGVNLGNMTTVTGAPAAFSMQGGSLIGNTAAIGGGIYHSTGVGAPGYQGEYVPGQVQSAWGSLEILPAAYVGGNVATDGRRSPPLNYHRFNQLVTFDQYLMGQGRYRYPFDGSLLNNDDINYMFGSSIGQTRAISYNNNFSPTQTLSVGVPAPYNHTLRTYGSTGFAAHPQGWTFLGWDTQSSATTPQYQPGDIYSGIPAGTVLYAIWAPPSYPYEIRYWQDAVGAGGTQFTPVSGTHTNGSAPFGTVYSTLVPGADITNNQPTGYGAGTIVNGTSTIVDGTNIINVLYVKASFNYTVEYWKDAVGAGGTQLTPVAGTHLGGSALFGTVYSTLVPPGDIPANQPAGYKPGTITNATVTIHPGTNTITVLYLPMDTINDFNKSTGSIFSKVGDPVTFTISFTLPADSAGYKGILVHDVLPSSLTYQALGSDVKVNGVVNPLLSINHSAGTLSVNLSEAFIQANEGALVEITVATTVNSNWDGSSNITNSAQLYVQTGATPPNPGVDTPVADDDATAIYSGLTKNAQSAVYTPGEELEYEISFTALATVDGNALATVLVSDNYDVSKLEYLRFKATADGVDVTAQFTAFNAGSLTLLSQAGSVLAGKEILITVVFKVKDGATGAISNEASVKLNGVDGGSDSEIIYPGDISKDAQAATYTPGADLDYEISFTAPHTIYGDDLSSVVVTDTYDASKVTFKSFTVTVDGVAANNAFTHADDNGTLIFTAANAESLAGKQVVITTVFTVAAGATGTISNSVKVDFNGQPGGRDDEDIDKGDLSKDVQAVVYTPGADLDYEISFTAPNAINGNPLSSVVVTDTYDASKVVYKDFTVTVDGVAANTAFNAVDNGSQVTFTATNAASLAGKSVVITTIFTVKDTATGTITNTASVSFNGIPSGDDEEKIDKGDLSKDAQAATYTPGADLEYEISFTAPNTINGDPLSSVAVTDTYDARKLTYKSFTATVDGVEANGAFSASDSSGVVTFTATDGASLAGKRVIITTLFTVDEGATGTISNSAEVLFNGHPGGQDDEVIDKSDLAKDVQADAYTPGTNLDYEISFTAPLLVSGNALSSIVVIDTYDANRVTFMGFSATADGAIVADAFTSSDAGGAVTFTALNPASLAGKKVVITTVFAVAEDAEGTIINSVAVKFNGMPGGSDEEEIDKEEPIVLEPIDDFSKSTASFFQKVGDPISFTVSFTLPEDASGYKGILVHDVLPAEITYQQIGSGITIGGISPLISLDHS